MSSRRYYITPYRLTKNPFLWRSIGLMTTLKPDQDIFLPETTCQWLKSNWVTISPENAALCIKYYEYTMEYAWSYHVPIAEKVLDLLILESNDRSKRIALSCPHTKEETLTKFIENDFKRLADKIQAASLDETTSWKGVPNVSDMSNWITYIASNPSLKTYQLELLWNLTPTPVSASRYVLGRVRYEIIPDYILKALLANIAEFEATYSTSMYLYPLLKEGMRRGMIVENNPITVTIPSQPRPTSFVKIVVPEEINAVVHGGASGH